MRLGRLKYYFHSIVLPDACVTGLLRDSCHIHIVGIDIANRNENYYNVIADSIIRSKLGKGFSEL